MEIAIPGQTSSTGLDVNKAIKDLVEVEKRPIKRLEKEIKKYNTEVRLWNNIESKMKQLEAFAKDLYGFNNPFAERLVESSDEKVLTAEAQRNIEEGEYFFTVKQLASADRWISKTIPEDFKAPRGNYVFSVGDEKVSFSFNGKSIDSLIERINTKGKEFVEARKIQQKSQDEGYQILLESKRKGKENALLLGGVAALFSRKVGLQKEYEEKENITVLPITKRSITTYISDETLFVEGKGNSLELQPGAAAKIIIDADIPQSIKNSQTATVTFTFSSLLQQSDVLKNISDNFYSPVDKALSTTLEDITIVGIHPQSGLENIEEKDFAVVMALQNDAPLFIKREESLIPNNEFNFSVPLKKIKDNEGRVAFVLVNPFPGYVLAVKRVVASNMEKGENKLLPVRSLSQAQNAIIEYDGIDIERETNTINDIIPGLTLSLKRSSKEQVLVSVSKDVDIIKNKIIGFVGSYNQLMRELTIYTGRDATVLDDFNFTSDSKRKEAEKNIGKLVREFNLLQLVVRLRSITVNPYANAVDQTITTLKSIGIAANLARTDTSIFSSRYLDIDENTLDSMISNKVLAVKHLFGGDNDEDGVIDNGAAFRIAGEVKPYLGVGGTIYQRKRTINRRVSDNKEQITKYSERVERYEAKLKEKFGKMESAINQLKDASTAFDRFNNNGN